MVEKIQYRWDFIGLSTDTKPTPETNDRVANGSTFYCSDNSKLYVWYKDQWYEKTVSGGGGGGTSNFNELSNRPKYNGAAMTGDTNIPEVITYSDFTGTDGTAAGASGLVPAPATTDAGKFLKADGTWGAAGGGGGVTPVQTTGTSTTDVMSQNATSSMVFADPGTGSKVKIGTGASALSDLSVVVGTAATDGGAYYNTLVGSSSIVGTGRSACVGIGYQANVSADNSIAIGRQTKIQQASSQSSVALGSWAEATRKGEVNIGAGTSGQGYNSTNYRVLGGVHDGQLAQDAVTVAQVNATIDAINTALSTNIPHIGAAS